MGSSIDGGSKMLRDRALKDAEVALLWVSYRQRPCDEHRNALVEAYQDLVRDVVRRFAIRLPRNIERGDLMTAANVGLMAAVGGFDPLRGVRFSSYCERRIKGALLDELRTQDWLPRPWRQRIELHKRTLERLRSETGREPHDPGVALPSHPDRGRLLRRGVGCSRSSSEVPQRRTFPRLRRG